MNLCVQGKVEERIEKEKLGLRLGGSASIDNLGVPITLARTSDWLDAYIHYVPTYLHSMTSTSASPLALLCDDSCFSTNARCFPFKPVMYAAIHLARFANR